MAVRCPSPGDCAEYEPHDGLDSWIERPFALFSEHSMAAEFWHRSREIEPVSELCQNSEPAESF